MHIERRILSSYFLRPGRLKRVIYCHKYRIRAYSGSDQEGRNLELLKSWTQTSSCDGASGNQKSIARKKNEAKLREIGQINCVRDADFLNFWKQVFVAAPLSVADQVVEMRQSKNVVFILEDLLVLLEQLQSLERFRDIDMIYRAYEGNLPELAKSCSAQAYSRFLGLILRAEFGLRNFQTFERLFSHYIKQPYLESAIVELGLLAFVKSKNFPLAKEFYNQILKNQETFPITSSGFHKFAFEIFKTSDLNAMKAVLNLWLENARQSQLLPQKRTMMLFHQLSLRYGDKQAFEALIKRNELKSLQYADSLEYKFCNFCHAVHSHQLTDKEMIVQKMDSFIDQIEGTGGNNFYYRMLQIAVAADDFQLINHIMSHVSRDTSVSLNEEYHKYIAHIFVKRGQLRALIDYFLHAVRPLKGGHLTKVFVEQLWSCALQNYPMLSKEFTNDLRLLLNKPIYLKQYYWLEHVLWTKMISDLRTKTTKEYGKNSRLALDDGFDEPRLLRKVEQHFKEGDFLSVRATIQERVILGVKPHFVVFYSLLKLALKYSVSTGEWIDDLLRRSHFNIPLKVDILWLRQNVFHTYRELSRTHVASASHSDAFLVATTKVREFEEKHKDALNFQNYLQLVSILLGLKDHSGAVQLLNSSKKKINKSDARELNMFYSTALRTYARSRDIDGYLRSLQNWNSDTNASLVTPANIRSCKGFFKYLKAHSDPTVPETRNRLSAILAEQKTLLTRFVGLKFNGLNDMRLLVRFLKEWADADVQLKGYKGVKKKVCPPDTQAP
ncbi:LAMI_0G00452g1_1 [Lachancea mirantina]|uniref:LAMI_0G00452g1_1 n=1 Tax=Lachancea mirantina TaxID=1230905 RepID=A0A1G4K728_9SACH|nr:LAMI_0G00452g1_1 [Lachancea mirantina]